MNTRTLLLAAAATFPLAAFTAQAEGAGGYVGTFYASSEFDPGNDADVWQGEGAFGYVGSGWGAQVDGAYGSIDDPTSNIDGWTLAGHLYWQQGDWRAGAVIASTWLSFGPLDATETSYGVEATYQAGAQTRLRASATLGNIDVDVLAPNLDTWNIDFGVTHHFMPALQAFAEVGFGGFEDPNGAPDTDTASVRIGGEYQPFSFPLSVVAQYDYFSMDADAASLTSDTDINNFSVGLRWRFNGGSLQENDAYTPFDTRTALYQRAYDLH